MFVAWLKIFLCDSVRDLCEDFVTGASVIKMAQETKNVLGDTFIYNVYLSD